MGGLRQQYSAEGLSGKTMTYLKAVEEQARLIIRKQGGKSRVPGIFQRKTFCFCRYKLF